MKSDEKITRKGNRQWRRAWRRLRRMLWRRVIKTFVRWSMVRKILAFMCVMYACIDLSVGPVRHVALSVPSVGVGVTFGALFGLVLAFWIIAGIKK